MTAILIIQDPMRGRVRELASEFVRRWRDKGADGKPLVRYGIAVEGAAVQECDGEPCAKCGERHLGECGGEGGKPGPCKTKGKPVPKGKQKAAPRESSAADRIYKQLPVGKIVEPDKLLALLRTDKPDLTDGQYQDALRHMVASGAVDLVPWSGPLDDLPKPGLALLLGKAADGKVYYGIKGTGKAPEPMPAPAPLPAESPGQTRAFVDTWAKERRFDTPLPELFNHLKQQYPDLTIGGFHDLIKSMHDKDQLRLSGWAGGVDRIESPELATFKGHKLIYYARPGDVPA